MFFKKTNDIKLTKCISIYISDKHGQIIIAPKHQNNAGIIYEQDECLLLDNTVGAFDLGTSVINNLNLYSIKDVNLRNHKPTDWSAFKHSKSKSVRAFEQEYISISVASCNEYNLIVDIQGLPFKSSELTVNSTISFHADKETLGQRIKDIYKACLTGKVF